MWRDWAALTFSALLLGAGLMANVTDGPMREHRGSWVTHALRLPALPQGDDVTDLLPLDDAQDVPRHCGHDPLVLVGKECLS